MTKRRRREGLRALVEEQDGFVLVFDHRFVFKPIERGIRLTTECPDCRRVVELAEKQPYRQFVLSWVPLWKTRRGETCLECPACHARFEIPDELRRAAAAARAREPVGPGV